MKVKSVRVLSLLLAGVMTLSLAACGGGATKPAESAANSQTAAQPSAEAKTMKISHNQAESHPVHQACLQFKEEVESKTNGSVIVDIYPNGQLADDVTGIDQVKLGSIQGAVAMGAVGTFVDAGTAYGSVEELPFLFSSYEEARAAWDGKLGQLMTERAEASSGVKVINYWENGFRNMTNNIRPITKPEDLEGIKFRVASSEIRTKTFETLNSAPITIAFTELFTALQQGTVDGQENPLAIITSSQFYEVQKYLSLSRHIYNTATFIVNPTFWSGLSTEEQEIIEAAAASASQKCRDLDDEAEKEAVEFLKGEGMEVTEEIDTAAFVEAVQPVWTYYTDTYGEEAAALIEAAQNP